MSRKADPKIQALAHAIHLRLRELEGSGRVVEVTPEMESILLNDPSYVPRHPGVRRITNPSMNVVKESANVLRTTIGALFGVELHPSGYAGPPSEAEKERRQIHRRGGTATPFTAVVFPAHVNDKVVAMIAEYPFGYSVGGTEEEALEALREALDFLLTDAYENTLATLKEKGRTFRQVPFAFQPPAKGRTR